MIVLATATGAATAFLQSNYRILSIFCQLWSKLREAKSREAVADLWYKPEKEAWPGSSECQGSASPNVESVQ